MFFTALHRFLNILYFPTFEPPLFRVKAIQFVKKFTTKIQQDAAVYQNFISYLYEAQHVSGYTPPIIRT